MSVTLFRLPDLGEGLTEAEVIDWRVKVGDVVDVDQVVVEVETAKAAVEVPCPYAGRVAALHGDPGTVLPVGQPLISIEPVDADPAPGEASREEERGGSGNVLIGYGTGAGTRRRRRRAPAPASAPGVHDGRRPDDRAAAVRVISPIVRRLAAERGVDLREVSATGPGGVICRRDVDAAASAATATVAPAGEEAGEVRTPLRGLRRAVAEKMSLSRREIPDVTVWVDADATALLEARATLNARHPERTVSLLALVAKACLAGLRRYPDLNSRIDVEAGEIVRFRAVNLGFAAQTDRGLVVPVVHGADAMSTLELSDALASLTAQAREGALAPAALTGGTFTLNNYGVFGVDGSTPIINHPEAALVGVGRVVDKPWSVDGQLAVRKVTQISLTFDHRVCDGGVAGGFLRFVADCVESPVVLLEEL